MKLARMPGLKMASDQQIVMAVIYCRVSADKRKGRSVGEQADLCRAECERRGWPIHPEVFVDNSIGASWRSTKERPEFEAMKKVLRPGYVLVNFADNRAHRNVETYADIRRLCIAQESFWCYGGRLYDMRVGKDRVDSARDAVQAEAAVEDMVTAMSRAIQANLERGRPHGQAPFGYRKIRDDSGEPITRVVDGREMVREMHPTEGPMVQEIFARYIAGDEPYEILLDMHQRGFVTRRGNRFAEKALTQILTNPTYAGFRTSQGKPVILGAWPALVPEEDFEAAQKVRESRRTSTAVRRGGRAPSWLLSGIALCGFPGCNNPLKGSVTKPKGYKVAYQYYACQPGYPRPGEMHAARKRELVDSVVEATLFSYLAAPDFRADLQERILSTDARAAERERYLNEARDKQAYLDGYLAEAFNPANGISAKFISELSARLNPEIAELYRKADQCRPEEHAELADLMSATDPRVHWNDVMDIRQRRALLRSTFSIRILPSGKGNRSRDTSLILIDWAEGLAGLTYAHGDRRAH